MVDAVLADCGGTQRRLRKLPARVVVYLLLAAALFEQAGYPAVWRKLTGPLESLPVPKSPPPPCGMPAPGSAPARCGPCSISCAGLPPRCHHRHPMVGDAGVRDRRTCLDVPDSPRCRARYRKGTNQYATAVYPQIRLTALVACGTRAIIDAAFGPCARGETVYGQRLLRCLHENMIVLLTAGLPPTPSWAPSPPPAPTSWPACPPAANRRSCAATRTAPSCPRSAMSRSDHRVRDHHRHLRRAADQDLPPGHDPARPEPAPGVRAGQALPRTLGGRVRLLRIKKTMLAAASCEPAPRPASPRRYMRYWRSIKSSGSRSPTPSTPPPAPTRTGPASPSPSKPPETRSSRPPTSSPPP